MILKKPLTLEETVFFIIDEDPYVVGSYTNVLGKDLKNFKFKIGNIFHENNGVIVSPANSYGNMDGGFDKDILDFFGYRIQANLESYIDNFHAKKLEIGESQIVPTRNGRFPYIIFSPTIEKPGDLATENSVYLSAKAIFNEILHFNNLTQNNNFVPISKVLMPGLGTGYGNLDPISSANMVKKAYFDIKNLYDNYK